MSESSFTDEEVRYLLSLSAVESVHRGRIRYSTLFKRECMRRYLAGDSPSAIFSEAGMPSSLIGYKRIERSIARWRQSLTSVETAAVRDGDGGGNGGVGAARRLSDDQMEELFENPSRIAGMFGHCRKPRQREYDDVRDLLIAQQTRRIDELERRVRELESQQQEPQQAEPRP